MKRQKIGLKKEAGPVGRPHEPQRIGTECVGSSRVRAARRARLEGDFRAFLRFQIGPRLRCGQPRLSRRQLFAQRRHVTFQGFDKAVRRAVLGTVRRAIRGAVPADQRLFGHGHAGQKVPPAPSGSARKKGTGGEGASGNLGMLRARPHATRIMRENTPSRRLIAARRRRSSRRLFPPNVRRSPNCGLWRQVQAERRAIAPPTGNARPKPP
jgi:hypothetical protein